MAGTTSSSTAGPPRLTGAPRLLILSDPKRLGVPLDLTSRVPGWEALSVKRLPERLAGDKDLDKVVAACARFVNRKRS